MQSTLSIFYFLDQIFILTEWFSVELAMAMISYTQDRVFHTDQIKVRAEFDCILCHSCILQDWYTVSPDYKQFFLSFFFTWFHLHFQIKWLLYFKSKFMSKKIMKQIFFLVAIIPASWMYYIWILQNLPLGLDSIPNHLFYSYFTFQSCVV